jgi:hypothetical protein
MRHEVTILLSVCSSLSCGAGPVLCSPSSQLAIAVRPEEAGTGVSIAGLTTGTVQAGTYADSLWHGPNFYVGPDSLVGGYHAGTYVVHIEATGYQPYDTSGVRVRLTGGECPVLATQRFTAGLVTTP